MSSEERLKRIEILLETCAKTAVTNREDIKSLTEQSLQDREYMRQNQVEITELRQQMASLTDMFTDLSLTVKS